MDHDYTLNINLNSAYAPPHIDTFAIISSNLKASHVDNCRWSLTAKQFHSSSNFTGSAFHVDNHHEHRDVAKWYN